MRTVTKVMPAEPPLPKRKRVAAYARVSNGKDAMLHSLSQQVSYYSEFIQRQPGWEYAGVYADEAFTGTKDNRPEFQRLLTDCRAGKIDMVLTKAITRFARNTVLLLEVVRELKALGIDIWFEKENIHTLSGDGEFMISILASYAQEESRSASENVKWRVRKKFQQGQPIKAAMLGYRLVDGVYQIVPEEAEIVKTIFADYLSGMGCDAICDKLNGMGIPSPLGLSWCRSTIWKIIRNETYAGDMILQKTYVEDHISKRTRVNDGVLPKYHVHRSHEAIISREDFEHVRIEAERRADRHYPSKKPPGR
jgi:DNA invertase Pin-like site-specific DNA recombinase